MKIRKCCSIVRVYNRSWCKRILCICNCNWWKVGLSLNLNTPSTKCPSKRPVLHWANFNLVCKCSSISHPRTVHSKCKDPSSRNIVTSPIHNDRNSKSYLSQSTCCSWNWCYVNWDIDIDLFVCCDQTEGIFYLECVDSLSRYSCRRETT